MRDLIDQLNVALAGRYALRRELGRGGMATVFLAEDLKNQRAVAIKVLSPELAAGLGVERFEREIRIVAGLPHHPHILTLHDSGTVGRLPYYVMPYLEGESLRERIAREKQLPIEDAVRIAREVADTLCFAHAHRIVHRDIKPENILLAGGHAVVADFGIARAIHVAGGQGVTTGEVMIGTPGYMSPEQLTNSQAIDGRSDIYSLACVLYEMLSGAPPFTGTTVQAIQSRHLFDPVPPLKSVRSRVPEALERAIEKALAKLPADRYSTASEFDDALAHSRSAAMTPAPPVALPPPARHSWRLALVGGAVVVVVIGALLVLRPGRHAPPAPAKPVHERSEIAVLPFQNLSADGPHAYFAGGLQDELLTQLAKVSALKVISRTSVMGYQGSPKPLKQIATELGVGSVVEGSVQVSGERLRVTVQLIDAATDEHLWAERYDRTLDDAFAIQSEVAQQIVAAVGATLTRAEQGKLAAAPTANAHAYQLYVQGRDYSRRPGNLEQNREIAQQLYERALALDPKFALAHAALSEVHGSTYFGMSDPSAARAARQREEAEAALRLAPDLPQAHVAMGLVHYWGHRHYRRALDEFGIALKGMPNDAELWSVMGYVERRLSNWDKALAELDKAAQLDPRHADSFFDLGLTYRYLHRYADAVQAYDKALDLAPDDYSSAIARGWTYFTWRGQLDTLRAVLSRIPKDAELSSNVAFERARILLLERNADSLLQVLKIAHVGVFKDANTVVPSTLLAAQAHRLRGDHAAARAAFDSARVLLDSALRELPDDFRLHAARGLALAGLGRRDEALHEARWLQQSAIYREDAFTGPALAGDRARILAQTGDAEAALDEIERLLARPCTFSVHLLRLSPAWDPIRDHPRFKTLLASRAETENAP